jgi:putative PIN family toxin of toxin-antitoxin system
MADRIVIDTNVFVSALLNPNGAPRGVLRLALRREVQPVFSAALFAEYEDVLSRQSVFARGRLNASEREALFDALLSVSDWVRIYYLWRPNLSDEADNHVIELAVASGSSAIITANLADFQRAELVFPDIAICDAETYLKERRPA